MEELEIYNDYSRWIRWRFSDFRVQKISVDAGFSCPNRDGRISWGGCTFCNNETFNPSYCSATKTVTEQLEEGKAFFSRKYPDMKYVAYFQAYSNTYAPLTRLKELYEEALEVSDVVGLIIGTRPDCITDELLEYLAELSKRYYVVVEYGIESTYDETLVRINRGHTFATSREAVIKTHDAGILTGGHVILGLPGETQEMMVRSAEMISELPLDFLKIHQLQIVKGTRMAQDGTKAMELEEYMQTLAQYLCHLRPSLVVERFVSQSPAALRIAPNWGLKNHEFTARFLKYMAEHHLQQGLSVSQHLHSDQESLA